jgi:TonB family protein
LCRWFSPNFFGAGLFLLRGTTMSPAQLYRPNPKWPFVTAFTAAAVLHVSVVALASLHRELPPPPFQDEWLVVGGDDPPPESTPAPEPDVPVESAIPVAEQDFTEAPPPPAHRIRHPADGPVRPPGHAGPVALGSLKPTMLSAPRPDYPYEARRRHLTGAGVAIVTVDSTNGSAIDVRMEQSTGDPILDHSAVSAFRRWRFKTGAPSKVRIPVTFTLTGASL